MVELKVLNTFYQYKNTYTLKWESRVGPQVHYRLFIIRNVCKGLEWLM